jgi:hypothetical protein
LTATIADKKMAALCSAAKFREETSKKQGGITAVLQCTMDIRVNICKRGDA